MRLQGTSRVQPSCRSLRRSHATAPSKPNLASPPSKKSGEAGLGIAERTRSLAALRSTGTFTTVTLKGAEGPGGLYASTLTYILDDTGIPIIAARKDAKHSEHLKEYPKGSLVIFSLVPPAFNPAKIPVPRLMLSGEWKKLELVPESQKSLERNFVTRHPAAASFLKELDFLRLTPTDIAFHTGIETHFLDKEEYFAANIDPIVKDSRKILEMMNDQHAAVLPKLCAEYGGVKKVDIVLMYNVDRFGFSDKGWTDHRFPFPFEMKDAKQVEDAMLENVEKLLGTKKTDSVKPKPAPSVRDQWPFSDTKW